MNNSPSANTFGKKPKKLKNSTTNYKKLYKYSFQIIIFRKRLIVSKLLKNYILFVKLRIFEVFYFWECYTRINFLVFRELERTKKNFIDNIFNIFDWKININASNKSINELYFFINLWVFMRAFVTEIINV